MVVQRDQTKGGLESTAKKPAWLLRLEKQEAKLRGSAKSGNKPGDDDYWGSSWVDKEDFGGSIPDVYVDLLCEVLEAKRLAGGLTCQSDGPFHVKLLGGDWLYSQKGLVYDCFCGEVRESSPAHPWVKQYGLNWYARFNISLYGEDGSDWLARSWCHKMEYFYARWEESGDPKYKYTPGVIAGYVPLAEFEAYEATAYAKKPAVQARLRELKALQPKSW